MSQSELSELSTNAQDYLKVVWGLQEWSEEPVTTGVLAARTGVRASTVSGAVGKLVERGLVDHAPYGAIALTDDGRSLALAMVRRHRLIETFLVTALGYGWDEVHDEAEHLEHAVSDLMVDRIDAFLGHPLRDPHGDPIPSAAGDPRAVAATRVSDAAPGAVVVERISDHDPSLLRWFAEHGLVVGSRILVDADGVTLPRQEGPPIVLDGAATNAIWVSTT